MKTAINFYEDVATEFGVTDNKALHIRQKIAFFSEQANQQRQILNRLVGDLAKARYDMEQAKDDTSRDAFQKQVNQYTNDVRQMVKSLDFFQSLADALQKDNPDVKATEQDVPESF